MWTCQIGFDRRNPLATGEMTEPQALHLGIVGSNLVGALQFVIRMTVERKGTVNPCQAQIPMNQFRVDLQRLLVRSLCLGHLSQTKVDVSHSGQHER